jgi:hypothetical protein
MPVKSIRTEEVSVYEVDSEIMGTAKIGSRIQKMIKEK